MKTITSLLATIFLLLAAMNLPAQQVPQTSQPIPPAAPQNASTSVPTITKETSLVLVDTVVTDKKGNYIRDLKQSDFRVFEDNKEQPIKSFSNEDEGATEANRKHYMVMFFDNSTMDLSDQAKARDAAMKFLDANTGANRYIAIMDFGGTLRVTQNFTTDAARLKDVVKNLKFSAVAPTPLNDTTSSPITAPTIGIPQLVNAEADFGVRTLLLALRDMARSLSAVPGRKTLVLFSSGFPLDPHDPNTFERESELTAAIAACNKANVAVYPVDVRGLITPMGAAPPLDLFPDSPEKFVSATLNLDAENNDDNPPAHLVYVQRGGTGGTGGGGGRTGGGGVGGGTTGGGHTGGTGSTGSGGSHTGGGTRGGGGAPVTGMGANPLPVAPYSSSRSLLPTVTDVSLNQEVLYELAEGTGGFIIVNTNDLLGGLQKIAHEQNEYYVLGYTPPGSDEGSCHVLKVKIDRSGTVVRSRSGYCNIRSTDLLAGKPVEKQLENHANGSEPGNVAASMRAPYFFISPNTARVNLAIEIPSSSVQFEKQKGKEHAEVNVLGIAYKADGSVAARFSDNVVFDFDSKDQVTKFLAKPYVYQNQFEIGSGHYKLKVAFTSGNNSFGKLETPLVVDTYDAKQFSMSAVALSKDLRPLNQEGGSLDAALLENRTPLVAQGMEIVPSGDDRFKKTDPAVFYAEVYDPRLVGTDPPKLGVQMLVVDLKTRQKKIDTGGPLPKNAAGTPVVSFGLRLPVDQLEPGSYELQVRAVDSTGAATPVRTADFQVD
jgi:VWFA-related protein